VRFVEINIFVAKTTRHAPASSDESKIKHHPQCCKEKFTPKSVVLVEIKPPKTENINAASAARPLNVFQN